MFGILMEIRMPATNVACKKVIKRAVAKMSTWFLKPTTTHKQILQKFQLWKYLH